MDGFETLRRTCGLQAQWTRDSPRTGEENRASPALTNSSLPAQEKHRAGISISRQPACTSMPCTGIQPPKHVQVEENNRGLVRIAPHRGTERGVRDFPALAQPITRAPSPTAFVERGGMV